MDMPDDTPTKLPSKGIVEDECIEPQQQEESFSSFDSNHKQVEGSSSSFDGNGFKNMHTYKQKQMSFPEVPANLGKLYQIYMYNVNRKKELKQSIEQLIAQQIKSLRVAYDKQTFSIQQFIDLDEQSKEYTSSKANYERRQEELHKLTRKYKELKIMQVQSMMILDKIMKNTVDKFIEKNKQIISSYVLDDTVVVLCKQKYKPKKIRGHKGKGEKKGTKKLIDSQLQQTQEQTLAHLQKASKSKASSNMGSASQNASEDEQQNKQIFKYVLRHFQFYKTQTGTSFEPLEPFSQLPPGKEYIGVIVEPLTKQYIAYDQLNLLVLQNNQRQLRTKSEQSFDSPIIFCQIFKAKLYVGTKDGIMRVYDIRENLGLSLSKIAFCSYGNGGRITGYALTNNPDIIIFIKQDSHLCEMNLNSYSSYLLSQLPEPVIKIDNKIIVTQNCFYADYYVPASNHGKVSLQHNSRLYALSKKGKIVKLHKHQNFEYLICEQGSGIFTVESL